jgi:xanthine/uracil permease
MFKQFAKDFGARVFRTFLQLLFGAIAIDGVRIFSDDQVNALVGAIGLIVSMIPTALSAWKSSRNAKATKLLNEGEVVEAKLVAAGQKT